MPREGRPIERDEYWLAVALKGRAPAGCLCLWLLLAGACWVEYRNRLLPRSLERFAPSVFS